MIKTGLTAEELERSALLLNGLLADHFTLLLKTWQFHWNVVGNSFGSYHEGMLKLYEAEIERVDDVAERISTLDFVREAMVAQQQAMGNEKGIVMDGRDIGTTVFPDAELKIFVTATPEIRAQRRYDELKAKGQEASFDEILENVKQRDYIDQNREVSPLRKAEDALLLDNTDLSIEEQKKWLFEQFNKVSK